MDADTLILRAVERCDHDERCLGVCDFCDALAEIRFVSPAAFAQEPTPIDIAILTCVGPGYIPDFDPFEALEGLPGKNCVKACKAAAGILVPRSSS